MNCKLSSLCYSKVSLVKWISFLLIRVCLLHTFCVIVMRMFINACWQVWDFCISRYKKLTSVTRGAECSGMFSLATFRICTENWHNSQRLDMYRLFVAISKLKDSLKHMKMKWFESLCFLCLWLRSTCHPFLPLCLLTEAVHFFSCKSFCDYA